MLKIAIFLQIGLAIGEDIVYNHPCTKMQNWLQFTKMKKPAVVFGSDYLWNCFWIVLGESLVDTAKMLPFLFLAYLLIEYIEHRHGERIEALLAGGGRWGAVPGALLGCVPQCGFSAIASNFYASRVITLGTLMAVYLATSDEAIPLLVSMPAYWDKLVVLMVIKVVYAVIVGFVLDFVLRGILPKGCGRLHRPCRRGGLPRGAQR